MLPPPAYQAGSLHYLTVSGTTLALLPVMSSEDKPIPGLKLASTQQSPRCTPSPEFSPYEGTPVRPVVFSNPYRDGGDLPDLGPTLQ